jgi:hypothetical protein
LNSSRLNLSIDGNTYLGLGPLGQVAPIRETSSELPQISFSLNGVPPDMVGLMLSEPVQGKAVRVKLAIFNSSTGAVLDTSLRYAGLLDYMGMSDGKDSSTITVVAESATLGLLRPAGVYFNNDDQQALYPGDLAMQYVNEQAEQKIVWPAASYWKK